MNLFKKFTLGAAVLGSLVAATPSQAVITTFAAFNPVSGVRNIRWARSGTANGALYSTSTGSSVTPGQVNVRFSFLQNYFVTNNIAQNITAKFLLNATTTNDPAVLTGTQLSQNIDGGFFELRSISAITVGSTVYAANSLLLRGDFKNAKLSGTLNGTAGGVEDSGLGPNVPASNVVYSSDFLDFNAISNPTIQRDFALALTAISPNLTNAPGTGRSLQSFRASASGNFSSDPAPFINAIPEPAVWGLMIAGFGMVGFQSRRRRAIASVTA